MSQTSLSICVITKNESRFLKTCLQSVFNIANEIIIVDSGSTDDTLAIAMSFNAKIFSISWQNDYAYARNVAISKCTGDWIFFLDADEYLENSQNLLKVLYKTMKKNTGGFLMERTDVYRHKENGLIIQYPVGLVRLFRNNPQFKYIGSVHEQINTVITDAGFQIDLLKQTRIIHQVHLSADDFLESKQRRYLQMIESELARDKYNFWMLYQQAKTYWFLGEKEKAKDIFSSTANLSDCALVIKCSCFCNKAVLLMEEGNFQEALIEVDKSLKLNPKQSMGSFIKGNIFYQSDEFKKSIDCYRKVKTSINKLKYNQVIPGDLYVKPEEIKYKIACCYMALGKSASARYLLKKALKINDKHVSSLLLIARIALLKKNTALAKELTFKCLTINPGWKPAKEFLLSF